MEKCHPTPAPATNTHVGIGSRNQMKYPQPTWSTCSFIHLSLKGRHLPLMVKSGKNFQDVSFLTQE